LVNNVILKGNLTHDPYYDVIPGSGTPFLRFYLGVTLPRDGIALTFLKGNVVQPPYYDLVGEEKRPFLRLYLAVNRPRPQEGEQKADFLRVVAYDDRALFDYPYLQPGSEVLVHGNLRARKRALRGGRTETVVEVIADADEGITFLRKVNFEEGDARRERILRERTKQQGPAEQPARREYGGGFFRIVAYGNLAQSAFPRLGAGVGAVVVGRLRARKRELPNGRRKTVVEVAARNITCLREVVS
jgi:single-stranded DNA-binding protein